MPKDLQIKAIEMAELPEVFKSLLSDNNNDVIYEKLGVKTFAEYVGGISFEVDYTYCQHFSAHSFL